MSDEIVSEKPVEEPKKEQESTAPAEAKNTDHMIPKTRLDEEITKRKEIEKQAKENATRLKEFEDAEVKRKQSEMSASEQAAARIKELEDANEQKDTLLKQTERRELQRKVAKAVGLPEGLANRLNGDDEEAMTADAQSVLELLPQQQDATSKKTSPKLDPTNPGDAKKGETDAMKRARLLGTHVNVWDANYAKTHGGGVEFVEKE